MILLPPQLPMPFPGGSAEPVPSGGTASIDFATLLAAADANGQASPTARRFDSDGLVAGAAPVAGLAPAPVPLQPGAVGATAALPLPMPEPGQARAAEAPLASSGAPARAGPSPTGRATPDRSVRVSSAATGVAAGSQPITVRRTAPARPIEAQRPTPRTPPHALNPVAVSIQALEQGLCIVARVGALVPAERERLRDAIAALLAEHGLIAHRVRIAGTADPRPAMENPQ